MTPRCFPHDRESAWQRLRAFLPSAPQYAAKRNYVIPGHPNVSRLSPALRHRLLLESEVLDAALDRYPLGRIEKFIQEVLWRTYWKAWMENHPEVWNHYRQQIESLQQDANPELQERAGQIRAGQSGIAIIDRFTNELLTTGYLHNHCRMWWASYWIHVEQLPWQWGAEFFFRHLIDADPASNTLSWRWVAGLHTRGKTYLIRESNLRRYCPIEWFEDTAGIERLRDSRVSAIPINETTLPSATAPTAIPGNLTDVAGRVGIWIHPDDCCLERGELAQCSPKSVCAFVPRPAYSKMGLSELRQQRLHTVLRDGVNRAALHFNRRPVFDETPHLPTAITQWAQRESLGAIVAFAPFVGPVNDGLTSIKASLHQMGIPLILLRRQWDQSLFPKVTGGFFPFWKRATKHLQQDSNSNQLFP